MPCRTSHLISLPDVFHPTFSQNFSRPETLHGLFLFLVISGVQSLFLNGRDPWGTLVKVNFA